MGLRGEAPPTQERIPHEVEERNLVRYPFERSENVEGGHDRTGMSCEERTTNGSTVVTSLPHLPRSGEAWPNTTSTPPHSQKNLDVVEEINNLVSFKSNYYRIHKTNLSSYHSKTSIFENKKLKHNINTANMKTGNHKKY